MIARNPKSKKLKEGAFIRGVKPAAGIGSSARDKRELVRVNTNFEPAFLERIDARAAETGLNRTSFIINAIAERLRQLEREV